MCNADAAIIILFPFSFRQSNPYFIGRRNLDTFWRSLSLKEKVDGKKIDKNMVLVRHQVFHPERSSVDGLNLCANRLRKGIENGGN
jgi:hypothetical protein